MIRRRRFFQPATGPHEIRKDDRMDQRGEAKRRQCRQKMRLDARLHGFIKNFRIINLQAEHERDHQKDHAQAAQRKKNSIHVARRQELFVIRQPHVYARTMRGQSFYRGDPANVVRGIFQGRAVEPDHRRALQKIVRTQTVRKPGGTTGG